MISLLKVLYLQTDFVSTKSKLANIFHSPHAIYSHFQNIILIIGKYAFLTLKHSFSLCFAVRFYENTHFECILNVCLIFLFSKTFKIIRVCSQKLRYFTIWMHHAFKFGGISAFYPKKNDRCRSDFFKTERCRSFFCNNC